MMRVFTGLSASGRWLAGSLAALAIARGLAGQTDTLSVSVGQEFVVVDGGKATRHLPFLASFNQRQIVTFSQHPDAVLFPTTDGMVVSSDGGQTWPDYVQSQSFYISGMARLQDGSLLAMSYITQRVGPTDNSAYYWTSTDGGANWTARVGNVHVPQSQVVRGANWGGFVFHRSILTMPDGSLRATMYGNFVGDSKFRSIWVRSDDGGANWTFVSTIAYSSTVGSEGFCEPVVVRAADGSLLVVMRTGSTSYPLYQARSTDGGLTWSQPTTLPGMDPTQTLSVDPDLTLMANGTLVLSYAAGNPDSRATNAPPCMGWSAVGSISGSGTNAGVAFLLTTDTTLTWRWPVGGGSNSP